MRFKLVFSIELSGIFVVLKSTHFSIFKGKIIALLINSPMKPLNWTKGVMVINNHPPLDLDVCNHSLSNVNEGGKML